MSRTHTLAELNRDEMSYHRLIAGTELEDRLIALGKARQNHPIDPDNAERGNLRFSHILNIATELTATSLKEKGQTVNNTAIFEEMAATGLPPLSENTFSKGFDITLGKGRKLHLEPEQAKEFYHLLEPIASSYAANKIAEIEKECVGKLDKKSRSFLENRCEQFTNAVSLYDKHPVQAGYLAQVREETENMLGEGAVFLPQDAFAFTAKVLNTNEKVKQQLGVAKDETLDYNTYLQKIAGLHRSELPTIQKNDLPNAIEYNGVTFNKEQIERIYNASRSIAHEYAQWHQGTLNQAIERDISTTTERPQATAFGKGSSEHTPEAALEGKGSIATTENKTEKTDTKPKREGLTFAGKVTVAAAAVGIVTAVLAMLLGRNSKQPAAAPAR